MPLLGRCFRIARQAIVEPDPVHLFGNPHMGSWDEGVAVVQGGERDAGALVSDLAPGEQPRAASWAEHAVELVGGGIARRLAFDGQRTLLEQSAGKERRAHRPLAVAAMTDADVDRLALSPEANRAA